MAKVIVTVELSFSADDISAGVIADLIRGKEENTTMLTENFGLFDYEPEEKIISVEVK